MEIIYKLAYSIKRLLCFIGLKYCYTSTTRNILSISLFIVTWFFSSSPGTPNHLVSNHIVLHEFRWLLLGWRMCIIIAMTYSLSFFSLSLHFASTLDNFYFCIASWCVAMFWKALIKYANCVYPPIYPIGIRFCQWSKVCNCTLNALGKLEYMPNKVESIVWEGGEFPFLE